MKDSEIQHLRRLIECWLNNNLIDKETYKAIKEDIEIFISIEKDDNQIK